MAPLPKRRHSTRRGGKRQAAIKTRLATLIKCANCDAFRMPHRVCPTCGFYDGKEIIKQRIKKEKSK